MLFATYPAVTLPMRIEAPTSASRAVSEHESAHRAAPPDPASRANLNDTLVWNTEYLNRLVALPSSMILS
jgi:hypothetical protein